MTQKIEDVLRMLKKVKRQGNGFLACCPAHDDKNPSLSINEEGGRVLVNCFAGCTQEAVLDAFEKMGISLFDSKKQELKYSPVLDDGKHIPDFESLLRHSPSTKWRYLDANGRLLGFVCRIDIENKPK